MSKINSELLDQQLKAEAPVAEASCAVSVYILHGLKLPCFCHPHRTSIRTAVFGMYLLLVYSTLETRPMQ